MSRQIDLVRRHSKKFEEALERAKAELASVDPHAESVGGGADSDRVVDALRSGHTESMAPADALAFDRLEATVLDRLRPAYYILEDKVQIKGEYDHVDVLRGNLSELERISKSVGRLDLVHHRTLSYAGTGWLIEKDVAVTNRHVAQIFAQPSWSGGFEFREGAFGETMESRLNYIRQHVSGDLKRRADVLEVLYVAGPGEPDFALLKVATHAETAPLEFFEAPLRSGRPVAAVGYPAWDGGRNDKELMEELFDSVYDVKRFSPGVLTGTTSEGIVILGDYTSLGGNSGSPVVDLETGKVLGLHFAGVFRESNYAVSANIVSAARKRVSQFVALPEIAEAPTSRADHFAGRDGYDPGFLGSRSRQVPLPALGPWMDDVAPVSDNSDNVLMYRHFSVIQCASRRLPLVTAVNIDGDQARRLKRRGTWRLDGRIDENHQIGNELYRHNPLDRGHMVRRRDPGWGGSRQEAQEAEIDTFHYTNSVPQHKDLNQKDWVGLEDYILEAAETKDFKVSVFTGPIFREDDKWLKRQPGAEDIQIPEEFWKIAVMVKGDTNQLSATGYVLSQGKMIQDLTEAAFILGQYETYQAQISRIEAATGLDFGHLRDFDPLAAVDEEAPFGESVLRISRPEDIRL